MGSTSFRAFRSFHLPGYGIRRTSHIKLAVWGSIGSRVSGTPPAVKGTAKHAFALMMPLPTVALGLGAYEIPTSSTFLFLIFLPRQIVNYGPVSFLDSHSAPAFPNAVPILRMVSLPLFVQLSMN